MTYNHFTCQKNDKPKCNDDNQLMHLEHDRQLSSEGSTSAAERDHHLFNVLPPGMRAAPKFPPDSNCNVDRDKACSFTVKSKVTRMFRNEGVVALAEFYSCRLA